MIKRFARIQQCNIIGYRIYTIFTLLYGPEAINIHWNAVGIITFSIYITSRNFLAQFRICDIPIYVREKYFWIIRLHHAEGCMCCYGHHSNKNIRCLNTDSLEIKRGSTDSRYVTTWFRSVFHHKVKIASIFFFAAKSF